MGKNIALAEILLCHGADLRRKSTSGDSPLCYAISDNQMELVKLYFRHGADFFMTCEGGVGLVVHAQEKAYKSTFDFLAELRARYALRDLFIKKQSQK